MGWRDLLAQADERFVYPWTGEAVLQRGQRSWRLQGVRPQEPGWGQFALEPRTCRFLAQAEPDSESLGYVVQGYLVGDRLLPDAVRVETPAALTQHAERVHFLPSGLDRFTRISAGRVSERGSLIFRSEEMPLGAEDAVLQAYLDQAPSVAAVAGVPPALDAAFRLEVWQREEVAKRRKEAEERRRLEAEQRAKEERRAALVKQLGDGAGRRELALVDFGEAARAALRVGGAEYLDHRKAVRAHEMVVRFRLEDRRFECICDERTLQIIDSGICLTAHEDNEDFDEGTKGDTWFTLESLPAVIRQALREHRLVVYRHVDR